MMVVGDGGVHPQTLWAVSATICSFAFCCSMVRRLPTIDVPNPHWGLRASCSCGKCWAASAILSASSAGVSARGDLVVMSPSATVLSSGTPRRGSNVPDRSSSYSSMSRCALTRWSTGSTIRS